MVILAIVCCRCSVLVPSSAADKVGDETMEGRRLGARKPKLPPPMLTGNKQIHMAPPYEVGQQPGKGGGPRDVHGGLGTMPQLGLAVGQQPGKKGGPRDHGGLGTMPPLGLGVYGAVANHMTAARP
ncbi:uncharacterized protein [Aegilops tauschii subsp. strangulata]|uniref:uncharacterized protein n=1 Tax=Aegilops tauschii subsp. strangulata TaxID=200361 RepID=UPI003CC88A8A